jgi:glycosyltransferase involved in cell wall biosynthesis
MYSLTHSVNAERDPVVTVVIPTRDRWPLLQRALASTFAQENVDLEVIVVDDGSQDATDTELARIVDARLRTIRLTRSSGVAHARNLAVAAARGKWIAFLDDDDFWAPTKLRRQLEAAGSNGDVIVYTATIVVDEFGRPTRIDRASPSIEVQRRLLDKNVLGHPSSVLVPTSLLRSAGGFDERLSIFADWDLWIRLLQVARPVAVNEPLVAYSEHSSNMHAVAIGDARRELRHMTRTHRHLLRTRRTGLGSAELSRWLLGRYRANGRRLDTAREYARVGLHQRSPRDLGRAVGILLGERALAAGKRIIGAAPTEPTPPIVEAPSWLEEANAPHPDRNTDAHVPYPEADRAHPAALKRAACEAPR